MRASEAANLLVEHYAEGATQHRTFKTLCVAALDLWLGQAHAIAGDINGASAHFSVSTSVMIGVMYLAISMGAIEFQNEPFAPSAVWPLDCVAEAMRSQRVAVTSRTLGKLIRRDSGGRVRLRLAGWRCAAEARRPEQAVQFLEQGSGH